MAPKNLLDRTTRVSGCAGAPAPRNARTYKAFPGFLALAARTGLAAAALSLSACISPPPAIAPEVIVNDGRLDLLPRIAIATAYTPEMAALLPDLQNGIEHRLNGVSFWTGELSGEPVVLFKTGVSIVNATMNTQLLLDHFNIRHILVSGVAGGLDPSLSIGDVTVPARWAQYNEGVYLRETEPGVFTAHPGVEPVLPTFDFMGTRAVRIARDRDPTPEPRLWFEADPGLLTIAEKAAARVELLQCDESGPCLPEPPEVLPGGSGVTGSTFMDNRRFRTYLFETFDAQVVEMETAAIAMVAYANDVPYIAFRSLSDLAGGGHAAQNEITAFEHLAARNSAALVHTYLEIYGEETAAPDSPAIAAPAQTDTCEIHFSTMPYEPKPLGAERAAKLLAHVATEADQVTFLTRFDDLSHRIASAMTGDSALARDAQIQLVWGGYNGSVDISLSMRLDTSSPEERALSTRIGAGLGYVFFQQSVAVECLQSAEGLTETRALALQETGSFDVLATDSLKSIYGMMIGQADGDTELGFTYYPESDQFLVLGLRDGGTAEMPVMEKVFSDLKRFSPQAEIELIESTRWIRFPYNDWITNPDGEAYIATGLTAEDLAKLETLRTEYLSALDALTAR